MKGGEQREMGNLITDKNFLNDNIFLFEKRLGSQYTIFFDNKTPTFTTYYHINNVNSITDSGWFNVERIIGSQSPIRFQKIENFPIYGIESIKPDLGDEDMGLQASFDGDAIILPNTIKPLPNDLFTISYLGTRFVFMVTEVNYDTIKSNNFYSINYTMRAESDVTEIEKQVLEKYDCVFENIGTDDKCLIRSNVFEKINIITDWCKKISREYTSLFYNVRYNSFLYDTGVGIFLYDRYLTQFINNNKLFAEKNSYNTLHLSNEDYKPSFISEYEDCIYRAIEDRDIDAVDYMRALHWTISYPDSIFKFYNVENVRSVFINRTGDHMYLPDALISNIKTNVTPSDDDILGNLLVKHFNNELNTVDAIDVGVLKKYKIRYVYTDFMMIPIALYCLLKTVRSELDNRNINDDRIYD